MNEPHQFPRRNQVEQWTPAEHAITKAMEAVEEAGAHPLLTEAVTLLQQARDKVADFVEQPIDGRTEEQKEAQAKNGQ